MRRRKLLIIFTLVYFTHVTCEANTFIVTSSADSGPGTLREAIGFANGNGTIAFDTIYFQIGSTTEAGRTISLQTELPALTSRIVIDASTQSGSAFGISQAKVMLFLDHYTPTPFTFLYIPNAQYVEIYSIFFKFFEDFSGIGGDHYAIRLRSSSFITVGKPGKGNLFTVRSAITNSYWSYFENEVSDITIQSNVLGLGSDNLPYYGGYISLNKAFNVTIGGATKAEGNVLFTGAALSQSNNLSQSFFVRIENNILRYNGTMQYPDKCVFFIEGGNVNINKPHNTTFRNNSAGSAEVSIDKVNDTVLIQGNFLGVKPSDTTCNFSEATKIVISRTHYTLIGGANPEDQNYIGGDIVANSDKVNIVQNSISGIILKGIATPLQHPEIIIKKYDNNLIEGTAPPLSKVQLYKNYGCAEPLRCPGKVYFDFVYADASGNWSYPYTDDMPNIVATATKDSTTGVFSTPKMDLSARTITNATCGKNNGSITGLKISEGTHFLWYNTSTLEIVGSDTNLINVPAGSYGLLLRNGPNGCPLNPTYEIKGIDLPDVPAALNISHPSCGKSDGFIAAFVDPYISVWMNANMDSIGKGNLLQNLPSGTYYLTLSVPGDTCRRIYGPYVLANLTGPSLNTDNILITEAQCEQPTGSITGITANNVTGNASFEWHDAYNMLISTSSDLNNVPPGKYRLKFKDESTCDTITTIFFVVPTLGGIRFDSTAIQIKPTTCNGNTGSISGLIVSNADSYEWRNVVTGNIVSTHADLVDAPAGKYRLFAKNDFYNCQSQSSVYTIGTAIPVVVKVVRAGFLDARCAQNNGEIIIHEINNNPSFYSFRWLKDSSTVVGTGLNINGLAPARYQCIATDSNGCEQQIYAQTIKMMPLPVIDDSRAVIKPDSCHLSLASIDRVAVISEMSDASFEWFDQNNILVSKNLLLKNVPAGSYHLVVTDSRKCSVESPVFIVGNTDKVITPPVYPDITIPKGISFTIKPNSANTGTYYLYNSSASANPLQNNTNGQFILPPLQSDIIYYVELKQGECVSSRVPVKVKAIDESKILLPNAFTPNGDGRNDKWGANIIGVVQLQHLRVYNRWGQLVFETNNPSTKWDGTLNGKSLPAGTYAWTLKAVDYQNRLIEQRGVVNIVR